MAVQLRNFTTEAVLNNYEALVKTAKAELQTTIDPLPFALAGLHVVTGGKVEERGYRSITYRETTIARRLFNTAVTAAARNLLEGNAALVDDVLTYDWVVGSVDAGPLKRLTRLDQATKALRASLVDTSLFIRYVRDGLFNWDNGDAQCAMAIVYRWRKAITSKGGIFESAAHIYRFGREVLETALRLHPNNRFLHIVEARGHIAWRRTNTAERDALFAKLNEFTNDRHRDERTLTARMLSLTAIGDIGIRFNKPELARPVVRKLQRLISPQQPRHPAILLMRANIEAHGGNVITARRLVSDIARRRDSVLRARASDILQSIGDAESANNLRMRLTRENLPRDFNRP